MKKTQGKHKDYEYLDFGGLRVFNEGSLPETFPQDVMVTSETRIFVVDDSPAVIVKMKKGISVNLTGFIKITLRSGNWRYFILKLLYPAYFK